MKKTTLLVALIAAAVFGAIFGYKFLVVRRTMAAMAAAKPPPVTVSTAVVRAEAWPNTINAVGSLKTHRGIVVKTETEGLVREVVATSGSAVDQGAVLVQVDTSVEDAQLSGLEAQARLAEINVGRARELRANGTNTQTELDTAETTLQQTRSAVAQLKATIAKKRIVAPFAGRLGIVQVYPGQFLSKGDAIAVLESIDPIHVDFSLPQQEISRLAVDQPVRLTVDAYPGESFEGKITALSPRVNDATRNLDVRATLPNRGEKLRPGMFARVEVVLPAQERALVIPAAAVVYNPYGETVYVVAANVAQQRFIKTGGTRGDLTRVRTGLQAGDVIVTSGQIKLRNDSAVRVDNSLAPDASAAPQPNES
ncbi:efflux RND transporter periplasmic adaptor subunit [Oleiharenicola sp. Vm1]|uniref:efflux RND transporter periplasmic adaptor subunit n=1 Tax=Oleiharenicola sp. Vm1 TaxID=3398393 RepID=UPI0039F563D7